MPSLPLTDTEREYLDLATKNEQRLKVIKELEAPFAYERSAEIKHRHDTMLAETRAEYEADERRLHEIRPQFERDQMRRHTHDLSQTNYGRSIAANTHAPLSPATAATNPMRALLDDLNQLSSTADPLNLAGKPSPAPAVPVPTRLKPPGGPKR